MGKIIITYTGSPDDALRRVLRVVEGGRVSRCWRGGKPIDHFCWVTTWMDGYVVSVRAKDYEGAADSFDVTRHQASRRPQTNKKAPGAKAGELSGFSG